MAGTPAEPGPEWLHAQEVGRMWGVRAGAVQAVAGWARVRSQRYAPTSGGTYGPPPPSWIYAAEDVRRVAAEIADGRRVLIPAWQRDSGPGMLTEAGERGRQALRSILVLVILAVVLVLPILLLVLVFG
ncbi:MULTISPECIES: hypothetical protein [unclassified Kitasatospora]|uniref:hypothetical protein n=1 Tax=unclassified Kitasatospora TaxID=2633591 RepID=UPI0033D6C00E